MSSGKPRVDAMPPTNCEDHMPTPTQIELARACIADSERAENSPGTRVDAAIQAIAYLDQVVLDRSDLQQYLEQKYQRPQDAFELYEYHAHVLALAKRLLSMAELNPAEMPWTPLRPESAAELFDALSNGVPPGQIAIFEATCSKQDAATVLSADVPLQAARDLMMAKLNEMGSA